MDTKKYYAVRVGRNPGIYESWDECKNQVFKFKGAVYASFKTKEEAEKFMQEDLISDESIDLSSLPAYAFVDGSFNSATCIYGYGGFIVKRTIDENGTIYKTEATITGNGNNEEMATMRNIAGELMGAEEVMKFAIKHKYTELYILYDYAGIENWALGLWKRNKKGTQDYYDYYQSIKDKIKIHFIKVKAHSGIPGNDRADKMAKQAVGLLPKDESNSSEELEKFFHYIV